MSKRYIELALDLRIKSFNNIIVCIDIKGHTLKEDDIPKTSDAKKSVLISAPHDFEMLAVNYNKIESRINESKKVEQTVLKPIETKRLPSDSGSDSLDYSIVQSNQDSEDPEPILISKESESEVTQSNETKTASNSTGSRTLLLCPKGLGSAPEGSKCPFGFKKDSYLIQGIHYD